MYTGTVTKAPPIDTVGGAPKRKLTQKEPGLLGVSLALGKH